MLNTDEVVRLPANAFVVREGHVLVLFDGLVVQTFHGRLGTVAIVDNVRVLPPTARVCAKSIWTRLGLRGEVSTVGVAVGRRFCLPGVFPVEDAARDSMVDRGHGCVGRCERASCSTSTPGTGCSWDPSTANAAVDGVEIRVCVQLGHDMLGADVLSPVQVASHHIEAVDVKPEANHVEVLEVSV